MKQIITFTAPSGDYVPVVDLPFTFTPTMDRHCLNVMILDDDVLEDDEENFNLILNADDSMVILAPNVADVRIIDTDSKKHH